MAVKRKIGILLAAIIAAILLISLFVYLPMQDPNLARWLGIDYVKSNGSSNLIQSGSPVSNTTWLKVAANAWAYFQPGVGVDPNTGLPYASGINFKGFTAWDLGVYIQAIIDAQELGLVNATGTWGSSARIDKVMQFLLDRPLNTTTGYPFWFYDATNGQDYTSLSNQATGVVDEADTGRLFVALNNLRSYNSSLTSSIDYVVYNESDYAALIPQVEGDASSISVYGYYIDSGFAAFWPQQLGNIPNEILSNIAKLPKVTTYGVQLPETALTSEPLLCSIFEINSTNTALNGLMSQVYLAQEACYKATGNYVAFSEGNSLTSQYIYEWVVWANGETWKITNINDQVVNVSPIIYTKVAFSFLALYDSAYAQNLLVYLQKTLPDPSTSGYCDGATNSGQCVPGTGSNTNGLILDAALYAIQHTS